MRRFAFCLLAVGLLTATAPADWQKMNGQAVPDISAKEWLNTGKQTPTTADLRGKVYLLEFFATW